MEEQGEGCVRNWVYTPQYTFENLGAICRNIFKNLEQNSANRCQSLSTIITMQHLALDEWKIFKNQQAVSWTQTYMLHNMQLVALKELTADCDTKALIKIMFN